MNIIKTPFSDVLLIQPKIFEDSRGFFYESFNQNKYRELGINKLFVQDNISRSVRNTLRGMHYQITKPQAKLVSVIKGEVFDVVIDIRKNSPNFGKWAGFILNDQNHHQLYIPEGFAHGFCVLSETADFMYKCTDYYFPEGERGVRFDDPDINIQWPIDLKQAIVSDKDKIYSVLAQIKPQDLP